MNYAIIRLQGKQYRVTQGDEILVGKVADEPKPEVLLIKNGEKLTIGTPTVQGSKVSLKVIKELEKGSKVTIFKYKSKSRYRRKTGFRPKYTRLEVSKISN